MNIFDELLTLTTRPSWMTDSITVERDANGYVIRAVIPGFEDKDLSVATRGNVIVISGKREKTETKNHFLSEDASFERTYTLPNDVQIDEISADYRAGVLVVTLPRRKTQAVEIKSVPIKVLGSSK
ncbi:MAG TPA: Hsp20/alpha crystallin family protein [Paenisporosarcina sp.]|nr:Hsp20/alpha crystallin family protein [Paenisporosarcina sp.]